VLNVKKLQNNPSIAEDRSERGQSFVEMAISLVFILVLLAGVVDLGRMFWVFVTLRDAAQEGASYASFCPADIPGIQARIRNSSTNPVNLSDTTNVTIVISPDCSNLANALLCEVGDPITITVANPTFRMSMPFMGGANIPLSNSVIDTILSDTQTCPP
jgi:Flp pilus assembly protein TadG